MVPADQRFGAGHPVILKTVLRLKVDFKLALCQSGLHAVNDFLLLQELAAELIVIVGKNFLYIPLMLRTASSARSHIRSTETFLSSTR